MLAARCLGRLKTSLARSTLTRIRSNYYQQPAAPVSYVAVVLSGSGVYDGSEIHEASAILVHLSRRKANVSLYAPDIDQMHVIDHCKGQPSEGETRNVLVESARIARGKITALTELDVSNHDAIFFPGGFGAAKNLSNFATEGANCEVIPEVARVLQEFHKARKPIGLCCIAPVLVAKTIPGCEVTVGWDQDKGGRWPHHGTAAAIAQMGATHVNANPTDVNVDETNLIVTTPAFMCETALYEIFDGIGNMIDRVLELTNQSQ